MASLLRYSWIRARCGLLTRRQCHGFVPAAARTTSSNPSASVRPRFASSSPAAQAASSEEEDRNDNIHTTLSKLLTREMLKTRRDWIPLDDDFNEMKEWIEQDWMVEYGKRTTILRRSSDDSSKNYYIEVSFDKTDLLQQRTPPKDPDEPSVEIDQTKEESEGRIEAKFRHPDIDDEGNEITDSSSNTNSNKPTKEKYSVVGTIFKVKIAQHPDRPALILDCGMDAGGESNDQIHIYNMEYGVTPVPPSFDKKQQQQQLQRPMEISFKFRNVEPMYDALYDFLKQDCEIDPSLCAFLINYNVFRIRREKLQFLHGVKAFLESE